MYIFIIYNINITAYYIIYKQPFVFSENAPKSKHQANKYLFKKMNENSARKARV